MLLLPCVLGLITIAAFGQDTPQSNTFSRPHSQRIQVKTEALAFALDFDQPPKPLKIAPARYPREAEGATLKAWSL